MDLMKEIKERLSIFKNLYDTFRVVDPVNKKTICLENESMSISKNNCFDSWMRGVFCENCISMRAYENNDTFVKIECTEKETFIITASPIIIDGKIYVVEILKDITVKSSIFLNKENNGKVINTLVSEMNDKIVKDDLTGIYNRRYINERLPVDISKSAVNGTFLSIIMADIDFFKKINDEYGHVAGDKILKDFAQLLKGAIRKDTDWVGRYGGEEFLIALNNVDSTAAYRIAEKIRKLIENTVFYYDETKIHITSSFGVYSLSNEKINVDQLISQADKNLYKAKNGGRNKIVFDTITKE